MASTSVNYTAPPPTSSEPKIRKIRLPRTSGRLAFPRAFCRLVEGVRTVSGIPWLDGPLLRPGQEMEIAADRCQLVVLECAGTEKPSHRAGPSPIVWILWCLDPETITWREIARTSAINWEWALTLAPLAERLLAEPVGIHEIRGRGVEVAAELVTWVEGRIRKEPDAVRKEAWLSLYDQIPGRIV